MKSKIRCISFVYLVSLLFISGGYTQNWVNLFNGKNLSGWHTLPGGEWKVERGIIKGTSTAAEPRHGLLVSDKEFGNFEIEVVYKAVKGNSGLYFRCEEVRDAVGVFGFQAEIDPEKDAGGLYETGGRAWVVKPSAEEVKTWYKPNTWNTMKVKAEGKNITVWVNGSQTATLTNDPGRVKGHIALQLHGGMDMEIYFKKVRIKPL